MDLTLRPVTADELNAYVRASAAGFGESPEWGDKHPNWAALELERTVAAFAGEEIVGTSRNLSLEIAVPGGTTVPAAGVSAVAVLPTHRRRGILRAMVGRLLDEAVEHEEPLAMLTASEGGIYGRFGFGVSSRRLGIELDRRDVEFARPRPEGRLRLVGTDEARKLEPELFERIRRSCVGAVSRPEAWWDDEQFHPEIGTRFDVVFESPAGQVDGFACYGIKERWTSTGAEDRLNVRDLVAATPDAHHALWRYLCEIDLVRTIVDDGTQVDNPLPLLLASRRGMRVTSLSDFVWTRILDLSVLGARTYAVEGRLGLEVRDAFRPGGAAGRTVTVEGGPDGATVAGGGEADLRCDVSACSAAWLGDVRWSTLAAAGLVEERTAGALARADAMFASQPLPYPYTWF